MPILDQAMRNPRPLMIVAENVEGTALSMLVHNHVNGIFQCVAVRAPGFGDCRLRKLEDIATMIGGEVYSKHSGFTLETMKASQLGRASQVRVTAERTAIVGGAGSPEAIKFWLFGDGGCCAVAGAIVAGNRALRDSGVSVTQGRSFDVPKIGGAGGGGCDGGSTDRG
jgi:chaperonin GroEL (HSP60 family)